VGRRRRAKEPQLLELSRVPATQADPQLSEISQLSTPGFGWPQSRLPVWLPARDLAEALKLGLLAACTNCRCVLLSARGARLPSLRPTRGKLLLLGGLLLSSGLLLLWWGLVILLL